MRLNASSLLQRLCDHEFPPEAESVGWATALDGKGERDAFVIHQRRCIHCDIVQQRWVYDLNDIVPLENTDELEGVFPL